MYAIRVDQERWVTIWAHVLRPETALRTIGAAADDDLDYLVPAQRIGLVVRPAAATQRLTSPNGPAYLREYVPSLAQYENRNVRTATGEYIATRTEPYVGAVAAQNYIVIVATHMGNPTSGSLTAPTAGTTAATF